MLSVGVLGLQGSVIEHINTLNKIGNIKVVCAKKADDILSLDGLILPGGESTAIGLLLQKKQLNKTYN